MSSWWRKIIFMLQEWDYGTGTNFQLSCFSVVMQWHSLSPGPTWKMAFQYKSVHWNIWPIFILAHGGGQRRSLPNQVTAATHLLASWSCSKLSTAGCRRDNSTLKGPLWTVYKTPVHFFYFSLLNPLSP